MVQSRTLAVHVQDDGFHEIQLNGKQLVFLFMSVTIVSVVVFLLGVLVGRNVRSAQDLERQAAVSATEPTADHLPPGPPAAPVSMSGSSATPSATPGGGDGPVATTGQVPTGELRPDPPSAVRAAERKADTATTSTPAVVSEPVAAKPAPVPVVPQAKPSPVTDAQAVAANTPRPASVASPAPRTGAPPDGWVVQVAALNDRGEADEIARRLVSKGYGAFVVAPASGNPAVYRVRVGTFKTKSEADMVGAKLKKEERFDPWITR